jgi:uncharacterized cofD-like protein
MARLPLLPTGPGLKRWLLLLTLSLVLTAFALSGLMGDIFSGWRLNLVSPVTLERLTKRVQSLRFVDFALLATGIWGLGFALRRLYFTILTVAAGSGSAQSATALQSASRRSRGPRIVAIGGGTGLPNLLAGLKGYTDKLTAVVTVADDGGSSGRLRKDLNILPPGDLRNCLVALAETEPLMARLFQHRFSHQGSLNGHSFGNLFIAALTEVTGDFAEALRASSKVLAVSGQVLPVTLDDVVLTAKLSDGRRIQGESRITAAHGQVAQLELQPPDARPNPEVLQAIAHADAIILGPGSLYTSILPNLLVPGVAKAVARSGAMKVLVCNVMTQPGETDGFPVSAHVQALKAQTGLDLADYVLANTEAPSADVLRRYAAKGQYPVALDRDAIEAQGVRLVRARLLETRDGLVRHHPGRLARTLIRLIVI